MITPEESAQHLEWIADKKVTLLTKSGKEVKGRVFDIANGFTFIDDGTHITAVPDWDVQTMHVIVKELPE